MVISYLRSVTFDTLKAFQIVVPYGLHIYVRGVSGLPGKDVSHALYGRCLVLLLPRRMCPMIFGMKDERTEGKRIS